MKDERADLINQINQLQQQITLLRQQLDTYEYEAQAFYVLAGVVKEYGLCNPNLQIARLEFDEQGESVGQMVRQFNLGEVINRGLHAAGRGHGRYSMGIATGMLVVEALSGVLFDEEKKRRVGSRVSP
jgi:hypothetical protein